MKNRLLLALAATLLLAISLPSNAIAQDAIDEASNAAYDDGFQNGDNGGANFTAWSITEVEIGAGDTTDPIAVDATSVGGDASLNSASPARALGMSFTWGSTIAAGNSTRDFSALPAGGKLRFRFQYVGDETVSGSSAAARVGDGSTFLFAVEHGGATGNWSLSNGPDTDTGISLASPIEVTATHNSTANFDIEINELVSPFGSYSDTAVAYASAGSPNRFVFSGADSGGSATYILFNGLIANPDGSLPVELSAFTLD